MTLRFRSMCAPISFARSVAQRSPKSLTPAPWAARVDAYLVEPASKASRRPAIVFGHWGQGNRNEVSARGHRLRPRRSGRAAESTILGPALPNPAGSFNMRTRGRTSTRRARPLWICAARLTCWRRLFAVVAGLPALIIPAVPVQHGEVRVRRLVIEIFHQVLRLRTIERTRHAAASIGGGDLGMAQRALSGVNVGVGRRGVAPLEVQARSNDSHSRYRDRQQAPFPHVSV